MFRGHIAEDIIRIAKIELVTPAQTAEFGKIDEIKR
jgi:hypothetical protein